MVVVADSEPLRGALRMPDHYHSHLKDDFAKKQYMETACWKEQIPVLRVEVTAACSLHWVERAHEPAAADGVAENASADVETAVVVVAEEADIVLAKMRSGRVVSIEGAMMGSLG